MHCAGDTNCSHRTNLSVEPSQFLNLACLLTWRNPVLESSQSSQPCSYFEGLSRVLSQALILVVCKASCLCSCVATVIIVSHSIVLKGLPFKPNRFSTACIIKSPTNPASMPLVVATPAHDLSVAPVQCKCNSDARSVVTGKLQSI